MAERTYRIGEAASLLNLKTYVLRFWETEFPQLVPLRTEKGQRLYTEADLALLRRIRFLLHERGLTIEGARRMLAERGTQSGTGMSDTGMASLADMPDPADRADLAGMSDTMGTGVAGLVGFGDDDPDDMHLPDGQDDDALADDDAAADMDGNAPAASGPQGRALSAAASRVQAWDQYLHGLLLPDDGAPPQSGTRSGLAAPSAGQGTTPDGVSDSFSTDGSVLGGPVPGAADPGTVREIIAELEAMRRLLAGAD
uniref:Transcriptional regulator, MerR family n=1 Tax=Nitratidesulfovibrio vulgaris (strain DSM 19637 / Miyazaki F) TaxID=883 RepID=B8DPM6_NITV9